MVKSLFLKVQLSIVQNLPPWCTFPVFSNVQFSITVYWHPSPCKVYLFFGSLVNLIFATKHAGPVIYIPVPVILLKSKMTSPKPIILSVFDFVLTWVVGTYVPDFT